MTHFTGRILSLALITAVAAGCATTPPAQDDRSFTERRDLLEGIEAWGLRGRIAVSTGTQAFQGRFAWQQDSGSLDLTIRGPLGAGVLEVSGPTDRLTMRARGETLELTDPEIELSRILGWWLPVESFGSWLLGIPDPAHDARTSIGPDDVLIGLEQRRWTVKYTTYQMAQGVILPEHIDLSYEALELHVSIDHWQSLGSGREP